MARGVPWYRTIKDPNATCVWNRYEFPAYEVGHSLNYSGREWFAAGCTLAKPFCWSPTKTFCFGGKRFIALYPCTAHETKNFGWIIQRGPEGLTLGRW